MSKKILSAEELEFFKQSVGNVKAIKKDAWLLRSDPKPKPKPLPKSQQIDITGKLQEHRDVFADNVFAEDTLSFIENGLQKDVLKKMRQGYFGADAQLDLHGLTSQQAKQQLLHFLHFCVEDGCRCVHIIHGKGYRSENNVPILKNHLNKWLRQHNDVQAFCSALPKDGGSGAVLILLRQNDKYAN